MTRWPTNALFAVLVAVALVGVGSAEARAPLGRPRVLAAPAPSFEENRGQAEAGVRFLSRLGDATAYVLDGEIVLLLNGAGEAGKTSAPHRLSLRLIDAKPAARIVGLEELPGKSHYYRGSDPSRWLTDIPHVRKVRLDEVYPGVALVLRAEPTHLEYDFELAPGVDAKTIRLALEGADGLEIAESGELVIRAGGRELRQPPPATFELRGSDRERVAANWVRRGPNELGFDVARRDEASPLLIDPILTYSTYLGGPSDDNSGYGALGIDAAGNVVVGGCALSGYPATPGAFQPTNAGLTDGFVTKLDPSTLPPTVVYSTYLGGTLGDCVIALEVDTAGNAYATGNTRSADYPTLNALNPTGSLDALDAMLTKLSPTGALVFSTYLGGTEASEANAITVDASGIYVAGWTYATDFPTTPGALQETDPDVGPRDLFVTKFAPSGESLVYSTYLPGTGGASPWHGLAVEGGVLYFAGWTASPQFPVVNAFQPVYGGGTGDAFVAALNATGSALVYSSFLGGSDLDVAWDLTVEGGKAYVVGQTFSADFPVTPTRYDGSLDGVHDAFLVRVGPTGALEYATYFGGSAGFGVDVEIVDGSPITTIGGIASSDLPIVDPIQGQSNGEDGFVAKLDLAANRLLSSTYLGGSGVENLVDLLVAPGGRTWVWGESRYSGDLPIRGGSAYSGEWDAYIAILDPDNELTLQPGDTLVAGEVGARVPQLVQVELSLGAETVARQRVGPTWSALALDGEGRFVVARNDGVAVRDLLRIDAATGAETTLASSGLVGPRALAIEADGDVLVADEGLNAVLRVPAGGGVPVALSGGFSSGPFGLALEADGDALTIEGVDLVHVDRISGARTVLCVSVGSAPSVRAVGPTGEVFLVDADEVRGVFTTSCGSLRVVSAGGNLADPVDLAVAADGEIRVLDAGSGSGARVVRIDPVSGVQTLVPSTGDEIGAPIAIAVLPQSVVAVDAGDDPVSVPMLDGLTTPGGLEVTLQATESGALTADYETQTPQERSDCVAAGTCPPLNFAVPGTTTQNWQIHFAGSFQGFATLVFRYSQALLGSFNETRLAVYHFVKGAWKRLPTVVDAANDRLTVEVPEADGFSPFVIGVIPACQDGEDNDGDTQIDLDDTGCTGAEDRSELPDCQDGLNNDADGRVDYPADPGCTGPTDPLETNSARACDDGLDNDGDEKIDYPADPNCGSPTGTRETPPPPPGCGFTGLEAFALIGVLRWITKRRAAR